MGERKVNVLKPEEQAAIITLLKHKVSQREISRKTNIDRKTIRKYGQQNQLIPPQGVEESKSPTHSVVATGDSESSGQNPPPRPPGSTGAGKKIPAHARSACEPHREWIEMQVRLGRNAMSIYQDLVELFAFSHRYNSVKRFVRGLKRHDPKQFDRLEFLPGEEAQVDYGQGARTKHESGKYRRPRLFVMTLRYSRRAFRKTVWKSSKETWARLHEEAFRYFGGCPEYVVLDNLKEGVLKPDIYEPLLNPLYASMLDHYDVVGDPARVRDPNRKGTVENGIKHTQNTGLKGRTFESIEAQNERLMHWEEHWASKRIHGSAKRQVEEMYQAEKPYLNELPLVPFRYFRPGVRTVNDDGTIQVDNSYYSALPAPLYSKVAVRIYDDEIEILDLLRMEVIRRHPKSGHPGSVTMKPEDRIFNPSRQTHSLLKRAEKIGPCTGKLCKNWFTEEGRAGQRRMYGVVNLVRQYEARYVERAAEIAVSAELRSYKTIKRLVENMVEENKEVSSDRDKELIQEHPLIRTGTDYEAFWNQHASGVEEPASSGTEPVVQPRMPVTRQQLPEIWKSADWRRVIEAFSLEVDTGRRCRKDELWIKSPFTREERASMHVNVVENIFKDFSSGKGGGIMQFCQEMLHRQGREMNIYEVARWMLDKGISELPGLSQAQATMNKNRMEGAGQTVPGSCSKIRHKENKPIEIDLRRYLRPDHPELVRRNISSATCRYLGCGFLPNRGSGEPRSPLNGRLVFQVRGVEENGKGIRSVILSHTGRALTRKQEETDGKYWCYPFRKGWEIYNQDNLLLDMEAWRQTKEFGLILVEGFFDVAALVEAGCRNVGALMGSTITREQIERLKWLHSRLKFPRITLFLDRDEAGTSGAERVGQQLERSGFDVEIFDWNQTVAWPDQIPGPIPEQIRDPGDISPCRLRWLRNQSRIQAHRPMDEKEKTRSIEP